MSYNLSLVVIHRECKKPMSIEGNKDYKIGVCTGCGKRKTMNDLDAEVINGLIMV